MKLYEAIQLLRRVVKTQSDPHLKRQGEQALHTLLDDRKTLQAAQRRLSQSPEDQALDEYEARWHND